MDGLHFLVVVLSGVFSSRQEWISGPEVRVTPGENVTLYCDCKLSLGVYIVWYRNCSHENQPSLVLKAVQRGSLGKEAKEYGYERLPHLEIVRNFSSDTYDLLISNISHSEEGLYYCGTEQKKVVQDKYIEPIYLYTYGNVTRIVLDSEVPQPPNCAVCWMLLFSLCSVVAVFSAFLSALLVYHLCRKKEFQGNHQNPDAGNPTRHDEDEDVSPAAMHIRQRTHRKIAQSMDDSIYSTVSYSSL